MAGSFWERVAYDQVLNGFRKPQFRHTLLDSIVLTILGWR
jgi:hypothetical protein